MLTIIKQAAQQTVKHTALSAAKWVATAKSTKGTAARSSGYAAEDAAAAWLQAQGLRIVERNVRYKFGEIDIVAWEGEGGNGGENNQAVLVLFEVRLRKNTRFGDAASSITPTKQRRLWAAGQAYAARFKQPPPMRIDVLAYSGVEAENIAPLWIKNALG